MKPEGISKKTKDNRNKHPHLREQWIKAKREGRTKQVWNVEKSAWEKAPQ